MEWCRRIWQTRSKRSVFRPEDRRCIDDSDRRGVVTLNRIFAWRIPRLLQWGSHEKMRNDESEIELSAGNSLHHNLPQFARL